MTEMQPTRETYTALQDAYDHFNRELFNDALPQALIVLHRKKGARGYFWSEMWQAHVDNESDTKTLDEIALTPETLDRSDKEVLSTLVHEMVHLWQYHKGKPSRSGYHNHEWADMMEDVGLHPTTDGTWQGKPTGQKCTHLIVDNHRFDVAATTFLTDRKVISWYGVTQGTKETKKNKVAYTCGCTPVIKVWAKPGITSLICSDCEQAFKEEVKQ